LRWKERKVDDPPIKTTAGDAIALCADPLHGTKSGEFVRVQAITRQTWDEAIQRVVLNDDRARWQPQQLITLLRTDYHLSHLASLKQLLQAILEDVGNVLGAQRAAIALHDPASGRLELREVVTRHRGVKTDQGFSQTLAERSFERGESLLCENAGRNRTLSAARSVLRGSMASLICAILRSPRRQLGVLHLDRGPMQDPFTPEDLFFADAVAARASVGIESALLIEEQRSQFLQTLNTLARAVEARDQYTGSHTLRVSEYALLLGRELGLSTEDQERIRVGTPLHDIGKIGIPDSILRKPGKLTSEEMEEMKSHPAKGVAILESYPALRPILSIVRSHHERWDGLGYPDGLAGDAIPLVARVVAVADAFDALTSDRCYRRGMSPDVAFEELRKHAGTQFDATCVQAFLAIQPQIEASLDKWRRSADFSPAGAPETTTASR
jgi:putative nucleotidyltransferase with HDIG domain